MKELFPSFLFFSFSIKIKFEIFVNFISLEKVGSRKACDFKENNVLFSYFEPRRSISLFLERIVLNVNDF